MREASELVGPGVQPNGQTPGDTVINCMDVGVPFGYTAGAQDSPISSHINVDDSVESMNHPPETLLRVQYGCGVYNVVRV